MRWAAVSLLSCLLAGCVSGKKFDSEKYQQSVTPEQVVVELDTYKDTNLLWGGKLVSTVNLENSTELEILAYPLGSNQKPATSRDPIGRFLVVEDQYLEPVDYAEGRLITIAGQISEIRSGQVGSAEYAYPVLAAEQIHLWSKDGKDSKPQVHFGVGVSFGF